jgi:serine/threonine-protein kinase
MQLKRLGPYEIGKPLGKGGMGSVFAAVDTQTGQHVAIKALTPHLAMAEGFRERFEAEIESLKTLRHEGIVRLFGYGEQDGVLFYSMELVNGISLEDELKAGRRFNWREVSSIAIQLSLALKHAHDHGIVHRDIKPANILLFNEDHVKLADFGIARLFGTTQLTTAGGVLGTADYMSPEQADGRPVTARCDQYSLGGVMYALLAGRPPFQAKNLPQMLQLQRFAKPEPVRRYAPDTPEQLEHVIMQLLAKNPADRFPNTQVLARHLQALVRALSRPASDDFALAGEPHAADGPDAVAGYDLASDATQIEAVPDRPSTSRQDGASEISIASASQDAATLAADDVMPSRQAGIKQPAGLPAPGIEKPRPADRPAHFTTIEEEEARRQAESQRSWIIMATQLAALGAVLAGMAAIAIYLSQPPSADKLYQTIRAQDKASDEVSLVTVENEIKDFLKRFPTDPRVGELKQYQERITLDKAERRLQRALRDSRDTEMALLPAERLYLRAASMAEISPDGAEAILRSLVALYGPGAAADVEESTSTAETNTGNRGGGDGRVALVVQLARRRIDELHKELLQQRKEILATLGERLNVAEQMSGSDPQQAAAMYRAIIDLYQNEPWAEKVVAVARGRLEELEQ